MTLKELTKLVKVHKEEIFFIKSRYNESFGSEIYKGDEYLGFVPLFQPEENIDTYEGSDLYSRCRTFKINNLDTRVKVESFLEAEWLYYIRDVWASHGRIRSNSSFLK